MIFVNFCDILFIIISNFNIKQYLYRNILHARVHHITLLQVRGKFSGSSKQEVFGLQDTTCSGTAGLITPYTVKNRHIAACGYINQFKWEDPLCTIDVF